LQFELPANYEAEDPSAIQPRKSRRIAGEEPSFANMDQPWLIDREELFQILYEKVKKNIKIIH
jgi:hypothetical protein